MYADHFSIDNIPFGIGSSEFHSRETVVTRLEDTVFFLDELAEAGVFKILKDETVKTFSEPTVNNFAALQKSEQLATRKAIQALFANGLESLRSLPPQSYSSIAETRLYLPLAIGDFTDFSCSRDHVLNASEAVFKKRELPPGFEYFPVGYTARTSSIVISGTKIKRPKGQYRDGEKVVFGPTRRLDYELEVACVIGKGNKLGDSIRVEDADEHIFGLVLLNDWSARDIQGLEMNPLGPLNGKSFSTSISPWIITLEALAPFKAQAPKKNPDIEVASYLQDSDSRSSYSIDLSASIESKVSTDTICTTNFDTLYWTLRDLVAHQTVNGCNLNTGDLLATGTVSGTTAESHGCLMEMAASGGVQVSSGKGESLKKMWLEDGDIVRLVGKAGPGVGFGDCKGEIVAAQS
ncbi:hypothetical protein BP5796_03942 [Coleophoma crateriformis]|uniref:Fumarylacetoacetase n=1 Tax=Coleophoma crateriformis TaxID=565419 RepID=A0A3D8SGY7_9HELO|nr:hypothetical protein BP5796_03942 [Coleophoma crateriformis]